ncbi:MAG: Rho termination factor N-terminal domain-containing protein, partial [Actinomycetota bacterium]
MDETQTPKRSMLAGKLVAELQTIATEMGVKEPKKLRKAELIDSILKVAAEPNGSKRPAPTTISETPERPPTEAAAAPSPAGTTPPLPGMAPRGRLDEAPRAPRAPESVRGRPVQRPAPSGDHPAPISEGTLTASGGATSAPVGTRVSEAPSSAPSAPEEARPDLRREPDGLRDRDRGRRRRRGRDRGLERPDRLERPRREYENDEPGELEVRHGVLDILPEGYGFLRTSGYLPGSEDVYVSLSQVRRFQLRRGDEIIGGVRRPKEGEKYQALVRIENINGMVPEEIVGRPWFERLTP